MGFSQHVKIKGFERLAKQFDNLEKKAAKRVLTKATRAGMKPILAAIRSEIPIDEGQLKKAQTSKIGGKGLLKYGVAGADVARLEADAAASGTSESGEYKRPANIDQLVEFGHTAADGTFVPPSGAMRKAADASIPQAEAAFLAKAESEIVKEAMKS